MVATEILSSGHETDIFAHRMPFQVLSRSGMKLRPRLEMNCEMKSLIYEIDMLYTS